MATSKAFCKRKGSKSRIESSTYLVREDDVIREVFRQQLYNSIVFSPGGPHYRMSVGRL